MTLTVLSGDTRYVWLYNAHVTGCQFNGTLLLQSPSQQRFLHLLYHLKHAEILLHRIGRFWKKSQIHRNCIVRGKTGTGMITRTQDLFTVFCSIWSRCCLHKNLDIWLAIFNLFKVHALISVRLFPVKIQWWHTEISKVSKSKWVLHICHADRLPLLIFLKCFTHT